jgi:hypothetical protein
VRSSPSPAAAVQRSGCSVRSIVFRSRMAEMLVRSPAFPAIVNVWGRGRCAQGLLGRVDRGGVASQP